MLTRVTPEALGGKADLQHFEDGLKWTLEAPMKFVEAALSTEADPATSR
ncbi:hypothetical protein [Mesorhizobium sp. B2-1-3A]|nr:hypothetical protein [Mesorhizobium sp. B2-1-3A]